MAQTSPVVTQFVLWNYTHFIKSYGLGNVVTEKMYEIWIFGFSWILANISGIYGDISTQIFRLIDHVSLILIYFISYFYPIYMKSYGLMNMVNEKNSGNLIFRFSWVLANISGICGDISTQIFRIIDQVSLIVINFTSYFYSIYVKSYGLMNIVTEKKKREEL